MIESPVPMDLSKVKTKFLGNFTSRQVAIFVITAVISVISYLILSRFIVDFEILVIVMSVITIFPLRFLIDVNGMPRERYYIDIVIKRWRYPVNRKSKYVYFKSNKKVLSDKEYKAKMKQHKKMEKKFPEYKGYE